MVDNTTFKTLALALPDVVALPHFEKISFRVKMKIFATLDEQNNKACLMLSKIDQSVFSAFDKSVVYPVPNKWGIQGATFIELKKIPKPILKDALNHAYKKIIEGKNYQKINT